MTPPPPDAPSPTTPTRSTSAPPTSETPRSPTRTRPTTREFAAVLDDVLHDRDDVPDGDGRRHARPRAPAQPIDERAEDDARATPSDPLLRVVGASPRRTRLHRRRLALARDPPRTRSARSTRRASPSHGPHRCHPTRRRVHRREPLVRGMAPPRWTSRARLPRHGAFRDPPRRCAARRGVDAARVSRGRVRIPPDGRARSKPHPRRLLRVRHRLLRCAAPAFLLVPGLYGRYYPCYMWGVRDHFRSRGAVVKISSAVDGEGTILRNAASLRREILAYHRETGAGNQRRVVLVGHSKGGADAPPRLALYESELSGVVRGLVASQCPYGGSPIASDLLAFPALEKLTARALESLVGLPAGARAACRPCATCRTPRGARSCRAIRSHARSRASVSTPPRRVARVFSTSPRRTCVDVRSRQRRTRRALRRGNTGERRRALVRGTGSRRLRVPAARGRRRVGRGSTRNRASREGGGGARGEGGGGARGDEEEARRRRREAARAGRDFDAFDGRARARRTHGRERARAARGGEGVGEEATLRGGRRRRRRRGGSDPRPMPPAVGPLIVRAYAALNDALPDRLRGVAEPGEYHEALVALLLEQEQPRKSGVESGVESARRREDDERVEECLGE